ncbi:alpha/beta hydrolase [Flammeovirga aprica]|uniref:Alpha/beta hydrolase n=1 Tax=Flammeovirga aprica JL-4 TaxID=694437 RepID=A0A7X9RUN2_9BACT|nr:alpha/beta hydrolase [Flammeovirga aprica]NME69047.1 alpha/beta hydrolase [Flammeovirga aprica JL-4]
MKAYCISGLGADHRVYENLELKYEKVHLHWIKPLEGESLKDYAIRLSENINQDEDYVIIGVSFGGLIAVEISKILKPKLTVLISTIEKSDELPFQYRIFRKMNFLKLLPPSFFNLPPFIASILFGTKNPLLRVILQDSDLNFTKWAILSLLRWTNSVSIENSLKINGTSDLILSSPRSDFYIEKGHHFMIVDRAEEIGKIINLYRK